MKVIIKDEIKEVKAGYARNFLIPKGMAILATKEAILELEEKERKILEKVKKLTKKFKDLKIKIKVKTGKDEKLFGAVTKKDIAKKLKEKKIKISQKAILIDKPIKKVGEYKIEINLGQGQKQSFLLVVVRQN